MPLAARAMPLEHSVGRVVPLPATNDRFQFLTDTGLQSPGNIPAKELQERCVTLAWPRGSLANDT
jgi:hypothetical protein